ncbi:hypothetical protein Tco_0862406 [Tanacetum coccineum]
MRRTFFTRYGRLLNLAGGRWSAGTDDRIIGADAVVGSEVCEIPDDDDTWRDLLRDGPECGTDGAVDENPDSDAKYSKECDGYGVDSGAALHRAMDALYPSGKEG